MVRIMAIQSSFFGNSKNTSRLVVKNISSNFIRLKRLLSQLHQVETVKDDNKQIYLGPLAELNKRISEGQLVPDEHQQRITEKLQIVYEEIANYTPESQGMFSKLFRRREVKKGPKGLYLYGTVGCGKTMLMDLFYSCCKVRTCRLFSLK